MSPIGQIWRVKPNGDILLKLSELPHTSGLSISVENLKIGRTKFTQAAENGLNCAALPTIEKKLVAGAGVVPRDQYRFRTEKDAEGERELWVAVLKEAIADAGRNKKAAVVWIHSNDQYIGSFEWICSQLGFDAAAVRRRLALNQDVTTVLAARPRRRKKKVKARACMNNGKTDEAVGQVQAQAEAAEPQPQSVSTSQPPSTPNHLDWLKKERQKFESRLSQAEAEAERLKTVVNNITGTLQALEDVRLPGSQRNGASPREAGLPRKSPGIPITDAIRGILNTAPAPVKYRDLARSVFEIKHESDWEKARRSLSGRLSEGIKKGYWRALGDGSFTATKGG